MKADYYRRYAKEVNADLHKIVSEELKLMDIVDSNEDSVPANAHSHTTTENGSMSHSSTGSYVLDAFFGILPTSKPDDVIRMIDRAWRECPEDALRLIFYMRAPRFGKGDKYSFYMACEYLRMEHPETLHANLEHVPAIGSYKDLCEISVNAVNGGVESTRRYRAKTPTLSEFKKLSHNDPEALKKLLDGRQREAKKSRMLDSLRLSRRYNEFEDVRKVLEAVAKIFARDLTDEHNPQRILAAKWSPSLDSEVDRRTLLATRIALQIYGPEEDPAKVRERYRKEILKPLRADIPEVLMSAKRFDEIEYPTVPSLCMKRNSRSFKRRDTERFEAYLEDVKANKQKINARVLFPHEILQHALDQDSDDVKLSDDLATAQWASLISGLANESTVSALKGAIAVCDVSGSMSGLPLLVAVSLSMVVSELVCAPWKNKFLTFSDKPQLVEIVGNTLVEKYNNICKAEWSSNTNYERLFMVLLQVQRELQLPSESMPRTLIVFSDMQFDESCDERATFTTTHSNVKRLYEISGLRMPKIVYWNLRDTCSSERGFPVRMNEQGVLMVSGFSPNILRLFTDSDMDPMSLVRTALDSEHLSKLKVVD